MKIVKTVSEKGVITITIDGVDVGQNRIRLSRELTETDFEAGSWGIFNSKPTDSFSYGDYKSNTIDFADGGIDNSDNDFAQKLSARIDKVRAWVAECRAKARTETTEILPREIAIQKMDDSNTLYYRAKNGTFQKFQ